MKSGLLKKFLSFSIGSWLSIIIGFISTPIITRILSPEEFGKSSLFMVILNVLLLISLFGTDQSFVRFFYEKDEETRKKLLRDCLKPPLFSFLILSIILLLFYKQTSLFVFSEESIWLAVILVFSLFIQIVNRYAVLIIRMEQKGFLFSLLQLFSKLFEFVGILAFAYYLGSTYKILIYSQALSYLFVTIIAIVFALSYWNFFKKNKVTSQHSMKEIVYYGVPLSITLLVTWLFQSTDRIAIKHWSTLTELGLYTAAFKIISILNVIQTTFTTFWAPVSYERYAKNPEDTEFFSNMNQIITLAMFIVGIGTLMFKDLIIYLLGPSYREVATIMPFLVFLPVMYTISETSVIGINFSKKTKWHIVISVSACLINVIGNIILVPKLGAKGAAISTGIAYFAFASLRTHVSLRYYKVDYGLRKFYFSSLLLMVYAWVNTQYNLLILNIVIGLIILVIICLLYKDIVRGFMAKDKKIKTVS
ncbi:lipopolysaccharide biosynthesis protein [Bacillus sp. BP-3]|uniref:lipopolysaccharide biosynthesis protein n=1 Tax=Bacillus sp. BP-3 TaxID=3022773 RepID=UPI00232F4CAF|nr:oligosaccharide flippase family protein [Bacillus sp. BP-3]MDC2866202.1 oligosaccharide flippase family protein [Bacillus sp. BP-3]